MGNEIYMEKYRGVRKRREGMIRRDMVLRERDIIEKGRMYVQDRESCC